MAEDRSFALSSFLTPLTLSHPFSSFLILSHPFDPSLSSVDRVCRPSRLPAASKYDGAGAALAHIYGPLQPPAPYDLGRLVALDQSEAVCGSLWPPRHIPGVASRDPLLEIVLEVARDVELAELAPSSRACGAAELPRSAELWSSVVASALGPLCHGLSV